MTKNKPKGRKPLPLDRKRVRIAPVVLPSTAARLTALAGNYDTLGYYLDAIADRLPEGSEK